MPRSCLLALAALLAAAPPARALTTGETAKGKRLSVPGFPTQAAYYFVPPDYDASKKYTLFLAFKIHHSGEEYGFYFSDLINEGDTIVAAMNLVSSRYWYYSSTYRRDKPHERVASLYKALGKQFNLSSRMFIATEGYGARVMQEFAFRFPKRVCGLAIHDPDYLCDVKWNTPKVPQLVTASSNSSWEMRRVEKFLADCKRNKYRCILFQTVPGYGDQYEGQARELLVDFYKRCTGSPEAGVPEEIVKSYKKAAELLKIDEYAEAIALLKPIAGSEDAGEFQKRARRMLVEIHAKAVERFEAAEALAKTDRDKAVAMYHDIAKKFQGSSVAEKSRERLKDLGVATIEPKDPVQPAPKDPDKPVEPEPVASKDEQLARKLLDEGNRLLAEGHRDKALSCFRAAAIHGETRAGREAAAKLKGLASTQVSPDPPPQPRKDPEPVEPQPPSVDKQCQSWLSLARNYIANQRYRQARAYLERVIRKSPKSTHAEEARILLEECRGN